MKKHIIFALGLSICVQMVAQEIVSPTRVSQFAIEKVYPQEQTLLLEYESFRLSADSGTLKHDLPLQFNVLGRSQSQPMPSNMLNTTGDFAEGYRLLPNGEHFQEPALISIPYDPFKIPMGYKAEDVYSYYYDEASAQWTQLERCAVDTIAHIITSYTTHFTDFANAVIKVPDMPESKAFVPTALTDMPDVNPLQGIPMIAAPTANNRGTAELTYPIELPKGRRGMQPNVDLHYSSAGGNGILGVGWSMQTPAITIDTRWGVPRYDPLNETEQYLVNGAAILFRDSNGTANELPYQTNSYLPRKKGVVRFYARDTKNQDRIIRSGSNPTTYWWAVTDRNGITTFYGRNFNPNNPSDNSIDESSVVRTDNNCIAYWAATASVDIYGNYILYNNTKINNTIYVNSITYTGNCNHGIPPLYRIAFHYKDRNDISTNGRLGVLQTEQNLLCNIVVQYLYPNEPGHYDLAENLAAYYMQYNSPDEKSIFKSRLESIVMLDSVHYIMPEEFENCELEHFLFENIQINEALLRTLLAEAEKNRDSSLYNQLSIALRTPYNSGSIPASTTTFSYADAPQSDAMFSSRIDTIYAPSGSELSASQSKSWSLGGTVTVGPGSDVSTTALSGGANYDYSRSTGNCTSMFMDLNGDGLTDIVYEEYGRVKYCRQYKQGDTYAFAQGVVVPGLTRLSREISNTHTWGLQLSFGASLSYSNPITTSYTDTYFSDINADGLPDMIDGDRILINHLDSNNNPSFVALEVGEQTISVHNSCNKSTIFDGQVDEHIECELQEVFIKSIPLANLYGTSKSLEYGVEIVNDSEMDYPVIKNSELDELDDIIFSEKPEIPFIGSQNMQSQDIQVPYDSIYGDSLIYRIAGNKVNVYRLEYVCSPTKLDPDIETVRVWVAPSSGNISICDSIFMIEDTSYSRQHSRTADGVSYTIQHCIGVVRQSDTLHASSYNLLHQGNLNANDYSHNHTWSQNVQVNAGDVILFRLRSLENNLFDKTYWRHIIQYDSTSVYDSEADFICTGNGLFQAYQNGNIILSLTGKNDGAIPVILKVFKNGEIIHSNSIAQGSINIQIADAVQSNDSVIIQLSYNGVEPRWSDIHLFPQLQYISDFPRDNSQTVHDTLTYYPDVRIEHSSIYTDCSSPYRQLFGPLHKGWGVFAYQNINNLDTIILDSLVNTQLCAALKTEWDTSFVPDTAFVNINNSDSLVNKVNTAFANDYAYNPLSDSSFWVPMRADSRTEKWIAYGNLGSIGKQQHSNARELIAYNVEEQSEEEIIEYDSSLPFAQGEERVNNFVRKKSQSIQHSVSWGALMMNQSASFGSNEAKVDYMDMNGDGYPDFVGKDGIQYSQPWGGIGSLKKVDNFSSFNSKTLANGLSFSACPAMLEKITGNSIHVGKYHLNGSLGVSSADGASSTKVQFIDVNADGLPDKIDVANRKVYYNLGYQFSQPYDFNVNVSEGSNSNNSSSVNFGSIPIPNVFSIAQKSISGGVSRSFSTNMSNEILMDINGDGLPDKVVHYDSYGNAKVYFNKGNQTFSTGKMLTGLTSIGWDETYNESKSLSVTAGISLAIVRIDFGVQTSPTSISTSQGQVLLTDMNGDGLVDFVTKGNNGTIYVKYNTAATANLLTAVTNPTGQRIELSYALSEPTSAHRSRQWNLSQVKDIAPAHPMQRAQECVTELTYANAYYDNFEKADYGYEYVSIITNQDKVSKAVYHNRSFLQNGELAEDSVMDSHGHMFVHRVHGMKYRDIISGEEHNGENGCDDANSRVAEDGYWTEYYEAEANPRITTRYTIHYDSLYNMVEYVDYGDVAVSNDDWRQVVTYLPNTANNMISLPKSEQVLGAGQLLRSSSVNYSYLGEPAHISLNVDNQGQIATTHVKYDRFGNIIAVIYPEDANHENNWSAFIYDSTTYANVVAIRNANHVNSLTRYDYRWGVPSRTIDPAGNEMRFTYDYKGRLSTVTSPIELAHGNPYTVKYEYNLINHNLVSNPQHLYTYVSKDMYDSLIVQKEVVLYDKRGKILQKKHYAEVNGQNAWVVDGAEDWDSYGRVIASEYPFLAQRDSDDYEPFNNSHPFVQTDYDVMDRPVMQINADGSKKLLQYHFGKDDTGVLRFQTTIIDENGICSAMLKSPQDWTIQQIAGDCSHTLFKYSPIGELLRTTDADGYQTIYTYDLIGRMIKRVHPDAGATYFKYDLASNLIEKQTENLALSSASIKYIYKFSRLMKIRYPLHPENNVTYSYDAAGRIAVRQDGTGSEEFLYDKLGNLAQSLRRIVIPTENNAYMFLTRFTYDSFGRMKSIRYPDGELVQYAYTTGGLLKSVIGQKQNHQHVYLQNRRYDEQGRVVEQTYGNNVQTQHVYDPQRQWLSHVSTFSNDTQDWLQDITYKYDAAGNITDIDQSAPPVSNGLGGKYDNHYQYDKQYRLIASKGSGDFTYSFSANYSPTGRLGQKYTATNAFTSDLLFGYDKSRLTHQPRTVYDSDNGTMNHFWDANGNLAQVVDCNQNAARLHEWDEENRLRFVLGEKYAGYYGYDANGERVYKLTGSSSMDDVNSGSIKAQAIFDDAVLYPNPYIVVTPKGYTKHYYAGTERLATAIGGGGFLHMQTPIVPLTSQHDMDIVKSFYEYYQDEDPFNYQQIISKSEPTEDIFGNEKPDLEYQCKPTELVMVDILNPQDILLKSISINEQNNGPDKEVYFYHGDHLGSANWITDADGKPIQYIHYAPYGELIANKQTIGYDERYKFTGKERDWETGYDYFGARFYDHRKGFWNSVDPLADKYPNVTPYLYCNGNPIMLVDPDGREKHIFLSKNESYAAKNFRDDSGIYIFGHGGPGSHGYIQNDANSSLDRRLSAAKLADHIVNESNQYKTDAVEGNTSMIFLYACHVGEGENNVAQQLSSILNDHETLVIGPIGTLESSHDPRHPQNGSYDGVKNSKTKGEGAWGVYKNGQLLTTIRGNRTPTKATVKCMMFFDNLLKSIKNFFKNENE